MNRQVRVLADGASVARHAAATLVERAGAAVRRHGSFCLVLSGEGTVEALCAALIADPTLYAAMPWTRTQLFFADGQEAAPARETLLALLPLPGTNLHRIPAGDPDAAAGACAYAAAIAETFELLGRKEGSARFDLVVLEIGADARIAALFPGAQALHEITALAVAVHPLPGQVARITLTRGVFNRAAAVLLLAVGAEKANALWRVLEGPADFEHLPAQTIRPDEGEVLWLADANAARRLSPALCPARAASAGFPGGSGAPRLPFS